MTERRLQITVEAIDKATEELKEIRTQLEGLDKAGKKSGEGFKESGKGADFLTGKLGPMLATVTGVTGGMMALRKAMDFSWDAALLTARVDTLGVVTEQLGSNVGFTRYEIRQEEEAIQDLGITTQASRQSIARMIESNIDLSASTKLAREAQDAAVIAGINSSEAFERLVNTIASGNIEMARTMGLNVNFQRSYNALAESLGKNVTELSELEKVQARTNEVLRAGANITGTYEAAMGTVGKQLSSLPRYYEEFKVAFGENFQEPLSDGVQLLTGLLKASTAAMEGRNALREAVERGFVSEQEYNEALKYGYISTELLTRAEVALEQEQIQLNAASKLGAGQMWDYAQMAGKANQEMVTLTTTQEVYEGKLKQLQSFVSGKLGPTQEEFIETQEALRLKMEETNAEADHLVSLGWSEQSSKVRDLRGEYEELKGQFEENADEHEDATKRMMFDLLTQQAAVDGLTAREMEFLTKLAGPEGWGLVDEATANATANATELLEDLNNGVVTSDQLVQGLAGSLDALAQDRTSTITIIHRDIFIEEWRQELATPDTNCFASGAMVDIPSGKKAIEELRIGDVVYAYDEAAQAVTERPVVALIRSTRSDLVRVTTSRGQYVCSPNHPWLTREGWTHAGQLRAGDALVTMSGESAVIAVEPAAGTIRIYNITVDVDHTYFVDGQATHNAKFKAAGGNVRAGEAVVVGERGPELLIPKQDSTIIPNHRIAQSSGGRMYNSSTSVVINVNGAGDPRAVAQQIMSMLRMQGVSV